MSPNTGMANRIVSGSTARAVSRPYPPPGQSGKGRLGTVGNSIKQDHGFRFLADVANDEVRFCGAAPRLALTRMGKFFDRLPPHRCILRLFWGRPRTRFDIFVILGYLETIKSCLNNRAQILRESIASRMTTNVRL